MEQTAELFSGREQPFSKIAEALGYSTFTVDKNPEASPSLVSVIGQLQVRELPSSPLVVWAAPPYHDVFRSAESWDSDGSLYPRTDEAQAAINIIRETVGLLAALKPTWWFIEHPKSLLRKMPLFAGFNRGYPTRNRQTIKHSQFGGKMACETDIWTNAYWWLPKPADESGDIGTIGQPCERVPPFVYAQMFEQFDIYRRSKV